MEQESGGVLVGVVAVEVGEDKASAAEDDVEAEFALAAEGAEFGVEAADLGGVEDAEGALAEAAAVVEDATGAAGVGAARRSARNGGGYRG